MSKLLETKKPTITTKLKEIFSKKNATAFTWLFELAMRLAAGFVLINGSDFIQVYVGYFFLCTAGLLVVVNFFKAYK